MTENQQKQLKVKIEDDLLNLQTRIKELEELCKPISPECALGDLGRFELMNDQDVYIEALRQSQIRENRLRFALERIVKDGELVCLECEDEIAFERLLILPEATLCMECASSKG